MIVDYNSTLLVMVSFAFMMVATTCNAFTFINHMGVVGVTAFWVGTVAGPYSWKSKLTTLMKEYFISSNFLQLTSLFQARPVVG